MAELGQGRDRFPWAGPVLFVSVRVLIAVFFWWFVQA